MNRDKLATLFLLLVSACAAAQEQSAQLGLEFHGSIYSDLSLYHYDIMDGDSLVFGGRNTLALNVKNTNREHGKLEASLDIVALYGAQADGVFGLVPDAALSLVALEGAPVLLDLRKLYYAIYLPFVDLSVGRQIINFGKGFVFSPLDAFSQVDIIDIAFRRRGSDVVAARFPLGTLAGVDLIAEFPVAGGEHVSAGKLFANIFGFDWSALGIYSHRCDELTVGMAFKGDVEIGVYGEAAEHFLEGIDNRYFEMMLGADYSLAEGDLVMQAEYLHSGKDDSVRSMWGKHNAFVSLTYRINDIMRVSGSAINNFTDETTIATLQYFYNILQNVDAVVYVRGYRGGIDSLLALPDVEYSLRVEVKF